MTSSDAPVLAIDVGTSAVKCGLAYGDGSVVAAVRPVATTAAAGGVHEVDADDWLRAVATCIGALGRPPRLAAVVVTGNGPTVVPAAADGRPLQPAITWLDRRSGAEVRLIAERTGRAREASFFLAKIYWVFRHAPELYRQTRGFVSGPEYVALRPHRALAHGPAGAGVSALLLGRRAGRRARHGPRQAAPVHRHRRRARQHHGGRRRRAGHSVGRAGVRRSARLRDGHAGHRGGDGAGDLQPVGQLGRGELLFPAPGRRPAAAVPAAHHRRSVQRSGIDFHYRQGARVVRAYRAG